MHAARFSAVLAVVEALIRANRISVTALGRMVRSRARPKHSIKRVDRLLSNPRLHGERQLFFRAIARQVIGDVARPIVLTDWTGVVDGFSALVAAVPVGGRASTIYAEVHPERDNNKQHIHARFLRALREVLPPGCRPIIVVDAGFKGPFFEQVRRLGWDFVGRERRHAHIRKPDGVWTVTKEVLASATSTPTDLGSCVLNKTTPVRVRLVLAASARSNNHPWRKRFSGGGAQRQTYRRGAHQPWLLLTSLTDFDPVRVTALYATRMQIEETFRDAKNPRFGWCLRHARGYSAHRLTILLMIAALAALVVTLVGVAAEKNGHQRAYQANTVRTRVLSHFVLGLAMLRRADPFPLGDLITSGLSHFRSVLSGLVS
jgi:hypothetical protein